MKLSISEHLTIPLEEIEFSAIRAQGSGGQHVNKTSSAIHLRFDIHNSSLPPEVKQRLIQSRDSRINKQGVIVIKAQQFRDQEKNRRDAIERLTQMIVPATKREKRRIKTKPTRNSQKRRLEGKSKHGLLKKFRRKVDF